MLSLRNAGARLANDDGQGEVLNGKEKRIVVAKL